VCGRFNVIDNPELQQLLRDLGIDLGLPTRTNIAPTETISLVRGAADARELADVRWWLTPRWAKQVDQKYSMFNARSETLDSSRAFREPFRRRRGIVPVSSFIEWRSEEGGRQPYLITGASGALALAAIWERWEGEGGSLETCALVTTAAAPVFESIHSRMPVMLAAGDRDRWLEPGEPVAADDPIFESRLREDLSVVPVSRGINNARNKQAELIEPCGEVRVLAA
jgi:putative SOS response-associated peptidase YedK